MWRKLCFLTVFPSIDGIDGDDDGDDDDDDDDGDDDDDEDEDDDDCKGGATSGLDGTCLNIIKHY